MNVKTQFIYTNKHITHIKIYCASQISNLSRNYIEINYYESELWAETLFLNFLEYKCDTDYNNI